MDSFSKQQTLETFRAQQNLQQAIWDCNTTTYDEWKAKDRAEKTRRYKLSLIRKWREKGGGR